MIVKIKIYLIIIFVGISLTSFGQLFHIKNYSTNEGLCSSQITCIIQDQKGYMWFGSYGGGISKFNGKEFINYTEKDGLNNNTIRALAEDSDGSIWIATLGSGICRFDGQEFIVLKDSLLDDISMYYSLLIDSKNQLWIGSAEGVFLYSNGVVKKPDFDLAENAIMSIIEDSKGRIWITSWENGVYCIDKETLFHINNRNGLVYNTVMQIYEDKEANIWFSPMAGVCYIKADADLNNPIVNHYNIPGLNDPMIFNIIQDQKMNYWFGDNKRGTIRINANDKKNILHINSNTGLSSDVTYYQFEDNEGNIWISTWGTGVSKFNNEKFVHFSEKELKGKSIINAIEICDSQLIISNSKYLLKYEDNFNPYIKHLTKGKSILSLCSDNNTLWVGCNKALYKYENNQITEYNSFRYPFLLNIKTISVDSKGTLWLGTWGTGIIKFNGKDFTRLDDSYGFPQNSYINAFYIDKSDHIWFGGWDFGLINIINDTINVIDTSRGLSSNNITGIIEDSYGNYWVSTFGGGINYIKNPNSDNPEIMLITTENGLKDDVVNGMVFNIDETQLWIATQKGICVLDYQNFLNDNEIQFEFYGKHEGFINIEATNNNSLVCDNDGNIWIGTKYGITRCKPDIVIQNTKSPHVHITNLKLFFNNTNWLNYSDSIDKWTGMPFNMELDYKNNHLTFQYIGINTTIPKKVKYKYILVGADKDWSPETDKTEVTYSSLLPGEYAFKVISMNNDGIWNEIPAEFNFIIKPPFWQTIWFYAICVIIVLIAFYMYVSFRTKKLKKAKEVLEQKVRERTAEIEQQKEEITAQRDSIGEKNEELNQQNEEIATQRDEIEAQRDKVMLQKNIIEEIHMEISQSIDYAKRIQTSILPDGRILNKYFNEHFVLFKPRDVVSGDFYWLAHIEGQTIVTAADCTGHGVPGAFMSMLGISFLREIVIKEYITHPGVILRKLRKEIINALKQKEETMDNILVSGMKDGMDMALISINHETNVMQYAGANNSLYIINPNRKKWPEGVLPFGEDLEGAEIKPDKMPISIYVRMDKYTTHEIQLEKGDQLYMFSDGFADQFGGPKGKKFKYKPFKQMLLDNADKPMKEQKEILDKIFEDWKGDLEQIDDIVILGLKI